MRLGLLADIHEDVDRLSNALSHLALAGVDEIIVLGDIVESGQRLEETVALLRDASAVGVWGNHDFGFCDEPSEQLLAKYPESVTSFMQGLAPFLSIANCRVSHVEPWLNPHDFADLWYFDGIPSTPTDARKSFDCCSEEFILVGHFHRWRAITMDSAIDWNGDSPLVLHKGDRYLVLVGALADGRFGIIDVEKRLIIPYSL